MAGRRGLRGRLAHHGRRLRGLSDISVHQITGGRSGSAVPAGHMESAEPTDADGTAVRYVSPPLRAGGYGCAEWVAGLRWSSVGGRLRYDGWAPAFGRCAGFGRSGRGRVGERWSARVGRRLRFRAGGSPPPRSAAHCRSSDPWSRARKPPGRAPHPSRCGEQGYCGLVQGVGPLLAGMGAATPARRPIAG